MRKIKEFEQKVKAVLERETALNLNEAQQKKVIELAIKWYAKNRREMPVKEFSKIIEKAKK
jgi:ribosome recycling factor